MGKTFKSNDQYSRKWLNNKKNSKKLLKKEKKTHKPIFEDVEIINPDNYGPET